MTFNLKNTLIFEWSLKIYLKKIRFLVQEFQFLKAANIEKKKTFVLFRRWPLKDIKKSQWLGLWKSLKIPHISVMLLRTQKFSNFFRMMASLNVFCSEDGLGQFLKKIKPFVLRRYLKKSLKFAPFNSEDEPPKVV